ncbi:BON domain-containing protein [Paracoccus salipaludis]|uniref:BON domain-containing protein n=1 Tax=Paracoccus salipaludis TaxID=2032623 RepID=A0A2A2GGQ8_9RHOB|nr:SWFGD domain-containing protein [Paracoccus salipaludis]PAU96083.1 hypothetical protein CK240_15705 [Paracoccus salipaludis]
MAQDWDDREGRGRGGYGHRDDYARRDRSRDWSDRAGDEVRSWLGDDDAERRRRMDEARGYGMAGSGRRGAYYADEGGGFGGGSGYDPYGSGRGDAGRWDEGPAYRGDYGAVRPGMTGMGMGMSSYPPSLGMDRDRPDYGGQGFGQRRYEQESWGGGSGERGFFERAGDEIASWFGDEEAQRRRERDAGHRGRGPRNYSRSDERIREDVSDRLSDDHHLDASDIVVSVSGGEVTLDGTVDSRAAKRHAEDLAERCSGVLHVQNNLRVRDRQSDFSRSGMTGSGTGGTGSDHR